MMAIQQILLKVCDQLGKGSQRKQTSCLEAGDPSAKYTTCL